MAVFETSVTSPVAHDADSRSTQPAPFCRGAVHCKLFEGGLRDLGCKCELEAARLCQRNWATSEIAQQTDVTLCTSEF